jgi:hypothetical protein
MNFQRIQIDLNKSMEIQEKKENDTVGVKLEWLGPLTVPMGKAHWACEVGPCQ